MNELDARKVEVIYIHEYYSRFSRSLLPTLTEMNNLIVRKLKIFDELLLKILSLSTQLEKCLKYFFEV